MLGAPKERFIGSILDIQSNNSKQSAVPLYCSAEVVGIFHILPNAGFDLLCALYHSSETKCMPHIYRAKPAAHVAHSIHFKI